VTVSDPRDIYELANDDDGRERWLGRRPDPDAPDEPDAASSDQPADDSRIDPEAYAYDVTDPDAPPAEQASPTPAPTPAPAPEVAPASGPGYDLAEPEPDPRDSAGLTGGGAGGRPLPRGTLPQRPAPSEPLVRDGPIFPDADRYCLECGYNLRGLHEPRCPECGGWFDPERPTTYYAKGDVSQELLRQDKTVRLTLYIVLGIVFVAGLPIVYMASDLFPGNFRWLGPMLVVTPWSALCAYALLWLVEHDRLVTLAAYLIAGIAFGLGLGLVAAIVGTVSHLVAAHAFSFEIGYLLLGAMGGLFAGFVRRYNTLSAI